MPKRRLLALALLLGLLLPVRPACCAGIKTWACAYGADVAPADYAPFDLVVLDGLRPPPLKRAAAGKPLLLGYVSVGEAQPGGAAWDAVQGKDYVLGKNREAMLLDLRSPEWQALLLDSLLPQVLAQGFDGLCLDGLDAALALGKPGSADAEVRAAAVAFLRQVRERFPQIPLAMNRGLGLLPEAASLLDYLLVEELTSEYDFRSQAYRPARPEARQMLVAALRKGQAANPQLTVLTLDYAGPDMRPQIQEAIRYARSKGFVPYVGTMALDQVSPHTLTPAKPGP